MAWEWAKHLSLLNHKTIRIIKPYRIWFCHSLHLIDETIKSQRGDMTNIICWWMSEVELEPRFLTGVCKVVPTKIQAVDNIGLAKCVVSVAATCLHSNNEKTKTIIHDTEARNHHCVPIKLYLHKQAEGQIGPMGCGMKISTPFALCFSFHISVSIRKM